LRLRGTPPVISFFGWLLQRVKIFKKVKILNHWPYEPHSTGSSRTADSYQLVKKIFSLMNSRVKRCHRLIRGVKFFLVNCTQKVTLILSSKLRTRDFLSLKFPDKTLSAIHCMPHIQYYILIDLITVTISSEEHDACSS
jgi:hypothetical protein